MLYAKADQRGALKKKYLPPSVTWVVSVIPFNKHNITALQNIPMYKQKCPESVTHHFPGNTQ